MATEMPLDPPPSLNADLRPTVGVGVVVLRSRGDVTEVLLIRRGQPPKLGHWSIPGGRQEPGEAGGETAAGEVGEETGVGIADLRLVDVVDLVQRRDDGAIEAHWTLVDFRATWAGGHATAATDAADARWVAVGDLKDYELW